MISDWLFAVAAGSFVIFSAIAAVITTAAIARRWMSPGIEDDRTYEMAATVAVRIATMHALILGLVYAQELEDYKELRGAVTEEATVVSDLWHDMRRYGGPEVAQVQKLLHDYLVTVAGEEWRMLGHDEGLSPRAWQQWDDTYEILLNLEPQNDRQAFLASRMRDRVTEIARLRDLRKAAADDHFGGVFWFPAVVGVLLLAIPLSVYRRTRSHLALLGIFGAYSGLILFFIWAFSNPFEKPAALSASPFERLLDGEIGSGP